MKTAVVLFFFGLVSSALATTYYIDYASGNDANNGTSESTPWKHQPNMGGWSGTYTHTAGDRFIFKGGVSWPNSCFGMWITTGGTASNPDYYGVDTNWYSGAVWSRPVFDAGGAVISSGADRNKFIGLSTSGNNLIVDNIEFRNYYWNSNNAYGSAIIQVGAATNVLIENCLFDRWSHGTYANGTRDNGVCILGVTSGVSPGTVASNCVFDGSSGDRKSMMAVYCIWKVTHCVATNLSNGFLVSGFPGEVDHCWIGPINASFDPSDHENSIETEGPAGTYYIHHNIIDGAIGACLLLGDSGSTFYVYDNLIFNSAPDPIGFDSSINTSKSATAYVWNNTVVSSSGSCVSSCRGNWTLIVQNNHFIAGGIGNCGLGTQSVTQDHNYQNSTVAIAGGLGFTYGNLFQPISVSSPTVGDGINLSASGVPDIGVDLNGVPRSGAWDIGAYQYSSDRPVSFTVSVVNGSGSGTYASNAIVPIIANSIANETFINWSATVPGLVANTNADSTTVKVKGNVTVTANYVTNQSVSSPGTGMLIPADNASITAPFVLSGGYILQPVETTVPVNGGAAIFTFTVTNAGNYVFRALVNAPTDGNNSFFVNVDAEPVDPTMIWDVPITSGFQPEMVGWRGNGTDTSDQFVPKVFSLSAGTHQLIIRGREMNTQLQSVTILSYDLQPPPGLHIVASSSP